MIERAIILKIQKEQPNVQLFIKLILMINRIYYPQMIAITVFSSTLLLFLNVSIYYYVYIFLLMQTIFISMSIMVDTFGTSKLSDSVLSEIICRHFDLRPTGIIKMLNLRQPIYKQTSAYGHFGRDDLDLSWEKTDKIEVLKEDYNSIISKKSK